MARQEEDVNRERRLLILLRSKFLGVKEVAVKSNSITPKPDLKAIAKKAEPNFGYSEMNYRLGHIFYRSVENFNVADSEMLKLEEQNKQAQGADLMIPIFAASERRIEAGVMALMSAQAWLEQILYAYAIHFLDVDWYDREVDRKMGIWKRWIEVPRICQNKQVSENCQAMKGLKELIAARDAVIHPKRKILFSGDKLEEEKARFLSVCRNLETTVASMKEILVTLDEPRPW